MHERAYWQKTQKIEADKCAKDSEKLLGEVMEVSSGRDYKSQIGQRAAERQRRNELCKKSAENSALCTKNY